MITIEQLLESVDLDFEPRWVTKDKNGEIWIWNSEPVKDCNWHIQRNAPREFYGFFITNKIKLSEFDGKDWTECIYEVPRKTTVSKMEIVEEIKKITPKNDGRRIVGVFNNYEIGAKINELVDAVNELKAKGVVNV